MCEQLGKALIQSPLVRLCPLQPTHDPSCNHRTRRRPHYMGLPEGKPTHRLLLASDGCPRVDPGRRGTCQQSTAQISHKVLNPIGDRTRVVGYSEGTNSNRRSFRFRFVRLQGKRQDDSRWSQHKRLRIAVVGELWQIGKFGNPMRSEKPHRRWNSVTPQQPNCNRGSLHSVPLGG